MPQSYDYDEGSETWPFFVLTMILMVLVPLTILQIWTLLFGVLDKEQEKDDYNKDFVLSKLSKKHTTSTIKAFRKKFELKTSTLLNWKNVVVIFGWLMVALLLQTISGNDAIQKAATGTFDPYTILGVSVTSTDREIKSTYRKLSLKFHPDKVSNELSAEEKTVMEELYVQITKAYEALTDELTKQNYLMYGHPDGPQSQMHGIALPSFLVNGAVTPVVLICYVLLLSLLLPYFVSKWWSRTQSYTKKGIHVKTASHFVDRMINYKPSEIVTVDLIINWLSHAEEYKIFFPHLGAKDFELLLQAHIKREDIKDSERDIQLRIVAKCHSLLNGLVEIACGFRNLEIASATLDTFKSIVQATPYSEYSEIFQLPNIDKEHFLENSNDIHTLGKLFTFDDEKIGKILGIKDKDQLKETLTVASNIPYLRILRAEFKVSGEKEVITNSIPYLSLKLMVRSARQKVIPMDKFPDASVSDPETFEFQKDPFAIDLEQPVVPNSYAPYFPTDRRNTWTVLIGLQKDNKIIQTPVSIDRLSFRNLNKDFDKRLIKELNDENFSPEDWEIGSFKVPLGQPAPKEKGDAYFKIVIKSTDYFGPDLDFTVTMQVREPPVQEKLEEIYSDDEEDDDSDENDESDDEMSGEEDDSDYTDIDTDTEDEDEGNVN